MSQRANYFHLVIFIVQLISSMNVGAKLIFKSVSNSRNNGSPPSHFKLFSQYFRCVSFRSNSFFILMTHRRVESMKDFTTSQMTTTATAAILSATPNVFYIYSFFPTHWVFVVGQTLTYCSFPHSLGWYECEVFSFQQTKYNTNKLNIFPPFTTFAINKKFRSDVKIHFFEVISWSVRLSIFKNQVGILVLNVTQFKKWISIHCVKLSFDWNIHSRPFTAVDILKQTATAIVAFHGPAHPC